MMHFYITLSFADAFQLTDGDLKVLNLTQYDKREYQLQVMASDNKYNESVSTITFFVNWFVNCFIFYTNTDRQTEDIFESINYMTHYSNTLV